MLLSEFIAQLHNIITEYGDDQVWFYRDGEYVGLLPDDVQFTDDTYEGEARGLYIGI